MKKIVLKLYEFDELSKDSQERIIEREHWNVMEQCMDAYGIDYKKSMKAFEDMTDTRVYNWEVGYERYDFSYEFKYKDPIYEHLTDYHLIDYYNAWCTYPEDFSLEDLMRQCYDNFFKSWHEEYEYWADNEDAIREELHHNQYEDRLYYENGDVYVEPLNEIA